MVLICRFDNDYSCNIETGIIYDPSGARIADISYATKAFDLHFAEMSDTDIWTFCSPIVAAHEEGVKQTKAKIARLILEMLDLKEE